MTSIDESLDDDRIIKRALLRIKTIGLAKGVGHRHWGLEHDRQAPFFPGTRSMYQVC